LYFSFLLQLVAGSVVPLFVFSILEIPILGIVALTFPQRDAKAPLATRAVSGLRSLVQAYIWLGWAAYCASLAIDYTSDPMVSQPWMFFVTALLVANLPIAFLKLKGKMGTESDDELGRLQEGTHLCRALTIVGFALFSLSPQLMAMPYGWLGVASNDVAVDASIEEVMEAAQRGVPTAQYRLGVMYAEGRGVLASDTKAANWWRAAAEQDHVASQSKLCGAYLQGQGVTRDDAVAARWCSSAAESGDAEASYHLGHLYTQGRGVPQDAASAEAWYRTAAEQGVPEAQAILGFNYASEADAPEDLVHAYQWLTLAASRFPFGPELTDVTEIRNEVRSKLTPEQLAQAARLVLEWQPIDRQGSFRR
jgi:TPR repeat protein